MSTNWDDFTPVDQSNNTVNWDEFSPVPGQKPKREAKKVGVKDVANTLDSALAEGVASIGAGVGTFVQAPAANTLSGLVNAAALADRGVTWIINKAAPGSAQVNPDLQDQARMASGFAAESREQNVASGNPIARAGSALEADSRRVVREVRASDEQNNPELVAQQREVADAEGFVDTAKTLVSNPLALTHSLVRSLPDMAFGVGAAATRARSVMAGADAVAEAAAKKAAASGLNAAEQAAAAEAAVKQLGDKAVMAASTAGTLSEAGSSAMQAREGTYQQVIGMPVEKLKDSPRFQELAKQYGDPVKAREVLANEVADQTPFLSAAGTAAGTLLANRLFGGDATAQSVVGANRMTLPEFGKRVAQDTVEEGLQGVPEDTVQFGAVSQADPSAKWDPAGSLAQNMVAGAAMGAGGHGLAYGRDMLAGRSESGSGPQPGVQQPRADVGQPTQAAQPQQPQGGASPSAQVAPTEAEKALREPVKLTALDRVNEIDSELAGIVSRQSEVTPEKGYGEVFEQERAELAQRAESLRAEREEIAKTWPKAAPGVQTSFTTEAGVKIDGQYALMDAGDLVTSHDENLRQNPVYPADLQPRDRSRSASEMQISGIVQKLDPARLGMSADAATGAPIVGADGLVESGNARTIALKRVYQANGQKAEDYKQFLRDNASQFGIDAAMVDAMAKPVLVRVRQTPVNRAEFARQANASTVQRMSPSEQALSDSKRLTTLEGLNPDDNGDFETSHDFIRQFMGMLPVTEQSDMIESDGRLSTYGYRRIQNAVLAKAYGDSPTLRRMTESMDDNLRNISKALVRVAPTIAAARERMEAGTLHQADLAPDLIHAVEGLSALKQKGWSVDDELGQADITGPKYGPEAAALLAFLNENIRSPRRIAEFLQRYYEALEAAGDPSQPSMFEEAPAPSRTQLLNTAQGQANDNAQDAQRGDAGKGAQPDAQSGRQSEAAQGGSERNQGDGSTRSASSGQGEQAPDASWVAFPKDSGTLGIPRAEMPQIKSEHRGAMIQFLAARGISHESKQIPASDLKPTQAEFSMDKVARFIKTGPIGERSVLASSDNYVLDGHHQWMAHRAMGGDVPVIVLDAPIRTLLAEIEQFPSVKRSEGGNLQEVRAQAVADFKAALGDLALIASKHLRAAMVPENTPGLMKTLVALFDSAIQIVGTDLKAATKYVKEQLKADPRFKTFWNKIASDTYQKAALQALENPSKREAQATLFDEPKSAQQGGLFDGLSDTGQEAAQINGRPYDPKRDNFKEPKPADVFDAALLQEADGYVAQFFQDAAPYEISEADRKEGERLLAPSMKLASEAKAQYDQKIIDIAQRVGALGQLLAPIKGIKRAVEKMHQDATNEGRAMDPADIKDLLRSTIVVQSYDQAQRVVDEIRAEFDVLPKRIKNRTDRILTGPNVRNEGFLASGYGDVLINVRMPNGTTAEIQINVPEMLVAKGNQGHKLYEIERNQQPGSDLAKKLIDAQKGLYSAAAALADRKNAASLLTDPDRGPAGSIPGSATRSPESDSLNQRPSGNLTKSSPEKSETNRQPSGKLSGTFITSPNASILSQQSVNGYTGETLTGEDDANKRIGQVDTQGKEPNTVQKPGRVGESGRVRSGVGGTDLFAGGDADASAAGAREVGQSGSGGVRGQDADGNVDQPRGSAGRPVGVPAGRDIAPKSGRNYRFGPDDLTYQGSWFKKAEQNVEAVELLKALESAGRPATSQEQAQLAKFIGWGASEIANNLFGDKLNKAQEALNQYEVAMGYFDRNGGKDLYRNQSGFYNAFTVLQAASKEPLSYYTMGAISKEMLVKAKPDSATRKWIDLRSRLKAALSEQEWAEASRSTQYAHYTSKQIVKSMWRAFDRMGFKGGAIIEPGAGIGVFPGLMPEATAVNSIYTGIEFDATTGKILSHLFPDERILVESFVDSRLPKDFYDVAIGNPPFSSNKVLTDPEYAKRALSLHDYFFAKSIDRTKPGGLVAFVTSRFTMDKLDDKARKYLAERADLVGAIRLPQTAFKQNAGTEVVTDVLFLRKKVPGETFDGAQDWAKAAPIDVNGNKYNINEYFVNHPEMVLGEHADTGSMYKERDYTVTPISGDIEDLFDKAVNNLPANIYKASRGSSAEAAQVREIDFNPKAQKEGNYYVSDAGALMVREGGVGQRVELRSQKDVELIKDFVPLRDALKQAHYDQLNDGNWSESLTTLQKAYDAFVKKHGQINQFTTKVSKVKATDEESGETYTDEVQTRVFPVLAKLQDDPDYTLVAALETLNEDTGEIKPSAFLTTRVLGKAESAKILSPADALLSVLNDLGHVDMGVIAARIGLSEAEAIDALGSAVYDDPEGGWTTADDYLSGNVKRKLDVARQAAASDKRFERNVKALEGAQPAPKTPSQINVSIGMNWIPGEVYSDFLREVTGVRADVEWNQRTKQWNVNERSGGHTMAAVADWGTDRRNATDLLEHALTGRAIRITDTVGYGKEKSTVFNAAATEAANQKLEALRDKFATWIWEDATRTDKLVKVFNDTFNTTVPRSFDGSHLTLPGTSKAFSVFDHVKRGAWRIIQSGNTYLAHAVGSGKTFQMVISAMEQKRLGLIKKPMVVVPNHMLKQFASEWQSLYPAARLMVADENNFHTDNRRRFVSRVALSDLDGVVITHSAFKLLDLDPEFKSKIIEEQLDYMRAALEEAESEEGKGAGRKSPRIKQIEKQIENLEEKLKASMSSVGKDKNVRFDELGVDFLYVDEAHEFRKLDFATSRQVKGISPQGSARALDLYVKARYLEEKTPGRSLVLASGTPVTNTLAELYTVQKFMDRQALEDRGIDDFDSWAAMFGRERTVLEPNAAGKYEPVTRFTKFVNVPELTQMFREYADVLTSDHLAALLGDKRPRVEGGSRKIVVTPKTDAYAEFQSELSSRVEASRNWKPTKDEPNNPDPMIRIIGDGRLAAIDMRFMDPTLENDPNSKLNLMIDDVIRVFKETSGAEYRDKAGNVEPNKGSSMMVFSDLGFGAGVAQSRGFNARAWFERRLREAGVPMDQVAFMSDYKKSSAKLKLFKDVNAGRVRILVGSSKNMGTGVNAQQRLKALFHLDSPWYPADLEQREGRIVRQGNKNPLVQIFAYAAKGSYDENMWKMLASKQFFIDQALSGDQNVRELEDLDSQSQYDLAAAMAAEDPRIIQLAGLRAEVEKLQRLFRAHEEQRMRFRSQHDHARFDVEFYEKRLPAAEAAAAKVQDLSGDNFRAKVLGKEFADRGKWAIALATQFKKLTANAQTQAMSLGQISGFDIEYVGETVDGNLITHLRLQTPLPVHLLSNTDGSVDRMLGEDAGPRTGLVMRVQNAVGDVSRAPDRMRRSIADARAQIEAVSARLETPFPMAEMLANKVKEAQDLEDQIASESKDKKYWVENKATKTGFELMAANPAEAISKAVATNGGSANDWEASLFDSAARGSGTTLSRGAGAGMDFNELRATVERIKAGMPNMPRVRVLPDPSKAPKALRDYIELQGAWDDVEGAMHNGELFMFASGLSDSARAEHVLAEHEAAHYGLRAILGQAGLRTVMNVIWAQNPSIRRAASAMQKRGTLTNAEAVEEVIVDIPTRDLAHLKGWRKLTAAVRDWLASRGFDRLAGKLGAWLDGSLTDQQRADLFVADLVRSARSYVAGKAGGPVKMSGTASTRLSASLAKDIEKQEKWLQSEARARGFKDIEDLLAKNYPLFEKLAELWRQQNPADTLLSRAIKAVTETPEFKRWFGNSKVRNDDGTPKVLYHGTPHDFSEFKPGGADPNNMTSGHAIWLSPDADHQPAAHNIGWRDEYREGTNVMPVYVKMERPLLIDDKPTLEWARKVFAGGSIEFPQLMPKRWMDEVTRDGEYDGIIFDGETLGWGKGTTEYIVFDPRQVKSAIGNNGQFDPTNPDISLSRGQKTPEKLAAKWRDMNPADGGVLLSRSAMKSVSANIERGQAAIAKAFSEKTTVHRAMFRAGLGWVDFVWGDEGRVKASGKTAGGKGLSHIVEARMRKDGLTEQQAIGVLNNLVTAVAAGAEISRNEVNGAIRVGIRQDGYIVWMAKQPGANAWVVTGYEVDPDKTAAGRATAAPTTSAASRTRGGEGAGSGGSVSALSRAINNTPAERADQILSQSAATPAPLDAVAKTLTRVTGVERLTGAIYNRAAYLLDRFTPERVKAGVVSDYGVPQSVIDQRVLLQGRQRVQLRKAGTLIEKLSTLTRAESRVAYEWMNMDGSDPRAYISMMQGLPEESIKVLTDVQRMIDDLSREAVRLGQLSQDAYERNKFAYLRRSYAKHVIEQTTGEAAKRSRVISILGDQYKGRGISESEPVSKIKGDAAEWWGRKMVAGQADTALKGEKFIRLEYRTHEKSGGYVRRFKNGKLKIYHQTSSVQAENKTGMLDGMEVDARDTVLKGVVYWPADQAIPAKYAEWDRAGEFEVRDVKGGNVVLWRDFTKDEREAMGEVDEARFAIAKTLHGMIHDVEVGRYLEWIAHNHAKKEGEAIPGKVVEASERFKDSFTSDEWVRVPDTKIPGTAVLKYGKLAGRYIPGPVWNDLRQVVGGQFKPLGETYAKVLGLWKTAKTALSPAVHTNNVMSNFVMADWHDVRAGHVAKSLRIILGASKREGSGLLGRAGNVVAKAGVSDHEAAREILNRYADSGGDIGSWVTSEIASDQLKPLLDALEAELEATSGQSVQAEVGVFAALQHALMLRLPSAWDAFKGTKAGKVVSTEAGNLIQLYQLEDDVFRLAAWLKAKEDGATDMEAGRKSRSSFLDYSVNAPWIQAMRQSAWPFVSFTYRAVPMLAEVAGKKPHKLMKLMMVAGALNALGVMIGGGGDDDERKLLPEEKAGRIWGMVPKLIRMPWNDGHGSAVYLDIRRFIPVGDVFDVGAGHSAIPILPGMQPGGPLVVAGEVLLNKSAFTGKSITLDTDTPGQQVAKVADHLFKAFAPNILGLPGTYATTGVADAVSGRTDAFGREMSATQAVASSFGVKLGSYPADVLRKNLAAAASAQTMEIDRNIAQLKRQRQTGRIDQAEFNEAVQVELGKKRKVAAELADKLNGR